MQIPLAFVVIWLAVSFGVFALWIAIIEFASWRARRRRRPPAALTVRLSPRPNFA